MATRVPLPMLYCRFSRIPRGVPAAMPATMRRVAAPNGRAVQHGSGMPMDVGCRASVALAACA